MRLRLLIVLLPLAILLAQTSEERIEDSGVSADSEASLPDDSLYQANLPPLKPKVPVQGSIGHTRVRFTNSYAVLRNGTGPNSFSDVWSRLRLSVENRLDFRVDLLAVRRVQDPQTIDELHLTVSGTHTPTDVDFTVGTYQVDWGLGTMTSAAYGPAREFSHTATFVPRAAQGIVARPTSREGSWLRGVAMERQLENFRLTVLGSYRPWNGDVESGIARLTGVIQPETSAGLSRRDQIDERLVGVGAEFSSDHVELAGLVQASKLSVPLKSIGSDLRQFTTVGTATWENIIARMELARSGSETAWQVFLSGLTGAWRGTGYASFAAPDYFAPRSQSPGSFGEPTSNESVLGVRAGFASGKHSFAGDVRNLSTPSATATVAPSREGAEAELNWNFVFTKAGLLSARFVSGEREESRVGEIVDRNYQRVRFSLSWQRGVLWSVRLEDRRSRGIDGTNPSVGSYQHLQVSLPDGNVQPGARVAFFSIPSVEGPMLIYEPSISGAYPLSSFSGDGRHLAAWLSVTVGNWNTRVKGTLTQQNEIDNSDKSLGLEIGFRY